MLRLANPAPIRVHTKPVRVPYENPRQTVLNRVKYGGQDARGRICHRAATPYTKSGLEPNRWLHEGTAAWPPEPKVTGSTPVGDTDLARSHRVATGLNSFAS